MSLNRPGNTRSTAGNSALDPELDEPLSGLHALVLGATGMIGAHTTRALLARGVRVRALVRPTSRAENLDGLDVERAAGDLMDPPSLDAALVDCDLLVHAAAPYPRSHFGGDAQTARAVESIGNVLRAARERVPLELMKPSMSNAGAPPLRELHNVPGLKRIVYVSSLTTIGPARPGGAIRFGRPVASESDAWDPSTERSPYFRMKAAMEEKALSAAREGLPLVVVNPSLCIDTLDVTPTTAQLLLGVERGQLRFGLPGVIDAVATRDVAVGIVRALAVGRTGTRYILGGESMRTTDLLARIARVAGVPPPRGTLPLGLLESVGWLTELWNLLARRAWPALPLSSVRMLRHGQPFDTSLADEEFRLPHTPLDVAIRDAFGWLHAPSTGPMR